MRQLLRHYSTDAMFRAVVIPIANQAQRVLHAHDLSELVVVRAGHGVHQLAGRDWPIATGEVFLVPATVAHCYHSMRGLGLINLLLHPPATWLPVRELQLLPGWRALFDAAPSDRPGGRLRLRPDELVEVCRRCERMRDEVRLARTGWRSAACGEMLSLLAQLVRWWPLRGDNTLDPRLSDLLDWIQSEHHRPLTVPELAHRISSSERSVQRLFRQHLGCTPQQHLERIRLEHAATLLPDRRLDIGTIATRVGFSDPSYFARRWRRRFGTPPRGR